MKPVIEELAGAWVSADGNTSSKQGVNGASLQINADNTFESRNIPGTIFMSGHPLYKTLLNGSGTWQLEYKDNEWTIDFRWRKVNLQVVDSSVPAAFSRTNDHEKLSFRLGDIEDFKFLVFIKSEISH